MKKKLFATTLLLALTFSVNASHAFDWKYMNPANWGTCPKCEKVCEEKCTCKTKCKCKKEKCNPCKKSKETCKPKCGCQPPTVDENSNEGQCDACDKLQDMAK